MLCRYVLLLRSIKYLRTFSGVSYSRTGTLLLERDTRVQMDRSSQAHFYSWKFLLRFSTFLRKCPVQSDIPSAALWIRNPQKLLPTLYSGLPIPTQFLLVKYRFSQLVIARQVTAGNVAEYEVIPFDNVKGSSMEKRSPGLRIVVYGSTGSFINSGWTWVRTSEKPCGDCQIGFVITPVSPWGWGYPICLTSLYRGTSRRLIPKQA